MSRVALAQIPSLTFYQDAETASRRGNPIPQLTCIGQACRLYTPEVVRCTSIGGSGTDVDWKVSLDHLSYSKARPLTPSLLVRSRSARSFALLTSGSVLRGVVWSRLPLCSEGLMWPRISPGSPPGLSSERQRSPTSFPLVSRCV